MKRTVIILAVLVALMITACAPPGDMHQENGDPVRVKLVMDPVLPEASGIIPGVSGYSVFFDEGILGGTGIDGNEQGIDKSLDGDKEIVLAEGELLPGTYRIGVLAYSEYDGAVSSIGVSEFTVTASDSPVTLKIVPDLPWYGRVRVKVDQNVAPLGWHSTSLSGDPLSFGIIAAYAQNKKEGTVLLPAGTYSDVIFHYGMMNNYHELKYGTDVTVVSEEETVLELKLGDFKHKPR